MVTTWDQGIFKENPSPLAPPHPQKEKNWMPHECMVNFLIGYMKLVFPKLFITIFWLKAMVGAHIIGQFNVLDILICQSYQIHCNSKL